MESRPSVPPSPPTASATGAPSGLPSPGATAPAAPCPDDMALIEGARCPEVEQRCLEHHPTHLRDPDAPERCLRYEEPTRCRSATRELMRFCIDRHEYPNRPGTRPLVLVDWAAARAACEAAGKRLCEEREWTFACEGEAARPYVTGFVRDAEACSLDRPYVERPRVLARFEECLASPRCARDFARVDQRRPSGASPRCVSPEGVFDLNGNVNEWVSVAGAAPPRRSGLKGGWWGPVRSRCRPTVRFHDEADWGYEIGFRCCREARPEGASGAPASPPAR